MLVTIITDASFCPDTRAGGYGCWIASDRGRGEFGGPLSGTADSTEAEAKAAANGLHHAITNGFVKQGDRILIQVDCKPVLDMFTGKRKGRMAERAAHDWLVTTAQRNGLHLIFRHVKGHNNDKSSRTLAQTKCDATARKYMEMERGRIKCEGLRTQIKAAKTPKPKKPKVKPVQASPEDNYWQNRFRQLVLSTVKFKV